MEGSGLRLEHREVEAQRDDGLITAAWWAYTGVCRSCAQGGGRLVETPKAAHREVTRVSRIKLKGD